LLVAGAGGEHGGPIVDRTVLSWPRLLCPAVSRQLSRALHVEGNVQALNLQEGDAKLNAVG
jgi:hypothetical protein